jgi:hypothetical protein
MNFETELSALLNKHGIDALCEMPDFILAAHLHRHILNIGVTQNAIRVHSGEAVPEALPTEMEK